jgi:hypothetical protein
MDENAVETRAVAPAVVVLDGVEVTSFDAVLVRLRESYPLEDAARIEAVLLREWEAFTSGRPTVIPTAVEAGAREILDQSSY